MYRKSNFSVKFLTASLFVLFAFDFTNAARANATATPEQTVKSFYTWYLGELNGERNPFKQKQKMLGFVSRRLGKWIYSKDYSEYGADYFISAQDFDGNWTPFVSKAAVSGNKASLKLVLDAPKGKKANWKQNLTVKMIKENGVWKIDEVINPDLTN